VKKIIDIVDYGLQMATIGTETAGQLSSVIL